MKIRDGKHRFVRRLIAHFLRPKTIEAPKKEDAPIIRDLPESIPDHGRLLSGDDRFAADAALIAAGIRTPKSRNS